MSSGAIGLYAEEKNNKEADTSNNVKMAVQAMHTPLVASGLLRRTPLPTLFRLCEEWRVSVNVGNVREESAETIFCSFFPKGVRLSAFWDGKHRWTTRPRGLDTACIIRRSARER